MFLAVLEFFTSISLVEKCQLVMDLACAYPDHPLTRTIFSFCFQIRVVNAFQEPAATPAQMPFRGRTSVASLASVAAKLESSKSEGKVSELRGDSLDGPSSPTIKEENESKAKLGETSL